MANTTLSVYENNAGGLSLLRHSDNAVFISLENLYSNGRPDDGQLLTDEEAEYWLTLDTDTENCIKVDEWYYRHADGHEFRFESEGADADCFDRDAQTPNGINLIAEYDGKWTTYPEVMGTNGLIATGQKELQYA